MKKSMIKIATMMATLSIAICAVGCGETNNDKISTEGTIIVTETTEVSQINDVTESVVDTENPNANEYESDEIIYARPIIRFDYVKVLVHSVPSAIDYEKVGQLTEDDVVHVIGEYNNEEGDFYKVLLENGVKGYVRKSNLEIFEWDGVTELDVIGYGTMTQWDMVASQPSEFEYVEVTDVDEGDKVKILREFNNEEEQLEYYEVRLESGEEGFVHKNRVNIDEWVEKENEE